MTQFYINMNIRELLPILIYPQKVVRVLQILRF